MDIRPIRNEADYDWALAEIEPYFAEEPVVGTPESDRFDVLAALIEKYEDRVWPIEPLDPVSAIQGWMQEYGYGQSDLAEVLGSRSRASELLRKKRPLSMAMAYRLHEQWKIPAEILIQPYALDLAA
jgi:HTH-type transcriptional regulator / antitoxin HigA